VATTPFNPVAATGIVAQASQGYVVLGTCTAFLRPDYALSAAHCVEKIDAGDIRVLFFARDGEMRRVDSVTKHTTADLCVMKLSPVEGDDLSGHSSNAFWGFAPAALGDEFMTYGYPVEGYQAVNPFLAAESARVIRGHYQRFSQFGVPGGYEFLAGEMSVTALAGMSGGPLFRPNAHPVLTGLVAGTVERSVTAYSKTEVRNGVETYTERVDRITVYGIALMLEPLRDWLTDHGPV
jgi:hypothetical protein